MRTYRFWSIFPALVQAVQWDYIAQKAFGSGHNFYHALMVAEYATLIAETEQLSLLGWIAGLVHDTDRIFSGMSAEEVAQKVRSYLKTAIHPSTLTEAEIEMIAEAVRDHSKRNDPADNPVTVILKDADRLINVGPYHWLSAGQFRPTAPVVDPRFITSSDPSATFKNPKSILQDLKHTLEWESWLRVPKAKELGKPKFDAVRWYIEEIENQFAILGLLPFPEELVVLPPCERSSE